MGACGWHLGVARPAGEGRRQTLIPHYSSSEELRVREKEAGCGWVPDGLSGLPTVDSESPLVWAAPWALTQRHGRSPLWNDSGMPAILNPLCPGLPLTRRHQRQCMSSLLSSPASAPPPSPGWKGLELRIG